MRSIRLGLALSLVAFGVLSAATLAAAEGERATAEEVVQKVKQAAIVSDCGRGSRSARANGSA